MTANDLLAAFETLADAPDGVKRLRELVLQLAVRGKLVAQDPGDEPASTIATELRRLRSSRRERAVKDDGEARELGFELPRGWATLPLGEMCSKIGAGSTPLGGAKVYVDDGVMFLRSQNVWNEGLRLHDVARILPDVHQRMSGTQVQPGDLLFNITGASIGRCGRVPTPFEAANVSQHVTIVRPYLATTQPFLHLVLISDVVQRRVFAEEVGVSREGLSIAKLGRFPVPLPPLAEQRRIVARVDQLMGLLDRLEAARTVRDETRRAARDAALAALRDAEDGDAVDAAWRRIAGQMEALFAEPEDVAPLRQAVLGLAVRGRLTGDDDRTWTATTLGGILIDGPTNGWSPKAVEHPTGVMSLKLSATTRGYFDGAQFKHVEPDGELDERLWLEPDDLLIQRSNTPEYVGTAAVFDGPPRTFIYPDLMMRCRVSPRHDVRFVHLAISAPDVRAWISAKASGTSKSMVKVNQATVASIPIRLPRRDRQEHIVAVASRYFKLCEDLEARLNTARGLHQQFAAAAVHHLDV